MCALYSVYIHYTVYTYTIQYMYTLYSISMPVYKSLCIVTIHDLLKHCNVYKYLFYIYTLYTHILIPCIHSHLYTYTLHRGQQWGCVSRVI